MTWTVYAARTSQLKMFVGYGSQFGGRKCTYFPLVTVVLSNKFDEERKVPDFSPHWLLTMAAILEAILAEKVDENFHLNKLCYKRADSLGGDSRRTDETKSIPPQPQWTQLLA